MGLFSWFFPSADDRIARAERLMSAERWADARLEILDLDHPRTAELLKRCETQLAQLNLDAAVTWAAAGNNERLEHHLQLAEKFNHGDSTDAFRTARRQIREAREERAEAKRRELAEEAARNTHDPYGGTGVPSWVDTSTPNIYHGDDDEAAARIALAVENYPPEIRTTVGELGANFAQAILDFEDGRADLALQGLLTLDESSAVVRYERARAAYALGDPKAAARELRAFEKIFGRHIQIGQQHTGEFLTLCLAETGQLTEALSSLRKIREKEPDVAGPLYAQLLEATGELEEAEVVLAKLIRKYPKESGLYSLLARVRVAGGHRKQAMAALESSLSGSSCAPGSCGHRPPDIGVIRQLATLYLEDGIETERGLELAAQAQGLVKQPTWEDAYLAALHSQLTEHPQAAKIVEALWENTPTGDARSERLAKYLPIHKGELESNSS